jgi:hypothetical protein
MKRASATLATSSTFFVTLLKDVASDVQEEDGYNNSFSI